MHHHIIIMRLRQLEEGNKRPGTSSAASRFRRNSESLMQRFPPRWAVIALAMTLGLVAYLSQNQYSNDGGLQTAVTSFFNLKPNASWKGDPCADLWRPDVLVGKCFGLEKAASEVKTWDACRALCCWQADCVTW